MTTGAADGSAIRSFRPSRSSRWAGWVGPAAALWSGLYGLLGVWWALGGGGFPFGAEHDPGGAGLSLLEHAEPTATAVLIAVVGLAGSTLAILMSGERRRHGSAALIALAGTMAGCLAVVVPDYRPLLALVRGPVLLFGAPFGWPEQVSIAEFVPLFLPWPVANQIVLMLGGLLWAATAVAYRRRLVGACPRCGRSADAGSGWSTPESAARWGRWAVAVAIAVPVGYAATRWAWALGIPVGISRRGLDTLGAENPGIWWGGAILATMGLGGATLTLGLVQRWGEVYPGWIPRLGGRPVRPRTAIIPASLAAMLLTSAGLTWVRWLLLGRVSLDTETWGLHLPQLFWPLWGAALGAATVAYHLRRRAGCPDCSRE